MFKKILKGINSGIDTAKKSINKLTDSFTNKSEKLFSKYKKQVGLIIAGVALTTGTASGAGIDNKVNADNSVSDSKAETKKQLGVTTQKYVNDFVNLIDSGNVSFDDFSKIISAHEMFSKVGITNSYKIRTQFFNENFQGVFKGTANQNNQIIDKVQELVQEKLNEKNNITEEIKTVKPVEIDSTIDNVKTIIDKEVSNENITDKPEVVVENEVTNTIKPTYFKNEKSGKEFNLTIDESGEILRVINLETNKELNKQAAKKTFEAYVRAEEKNKTEVKNEDKANVKPIVNNQKAGLNASFGDSNSKVNLEATLSTGTKSDYGINANYVSVFDNSKSAIKIEGELTKNRKFIAGTFGRIFNDFEIKSTLSHLRQDVDFGKYGNTEVSQNSFSLDYNHYLNSDYIKTVGLSGNISNSDSKVIGTEYKTIVSGASETKNKHIYTAVGANSKNLALNADLIINGKTNFKPFLGYSNIKYDDGEKVSKSIYGADLNIDYSKDIDLDFSYKNNGVFDNFEAKWKRDFQNYYVALNAGTTRYDDSNIEDNNYVGVKLGTSFGKTVSIKENDLRMKKYYVDTFSRASSTPQNVVTKFKETIENVYSIVNVPNIISTVTLNSDSGILGDNKTNVTNPFIGINIPTNSTYIEYRINGGSWNNVGLVNTFQITSGTVEGNNVVEVRGGNAGGAGAIRIYNYTQDTIAPTLAGFPSAPDTRNQNYVTMDYNFNENVVKVGTVNFNFGTTVSGSGSFGYNVPGTSGNYSFSGNTLRMNNFLTEGVNPGDIINFTDVEDEAGNKASGSDGFALPNP